MKPLFHRLRSLTVREVVINLALWSYSVAVLAWSVYFKHKA